jgi:hypothetical protein
MPVPGNILEPAIRQVAQFCESHVPEDARDELRLEHNVRGASITIVERRPPWSELVGPDWTSMKIAQLRYDEHDRSWSLYACDREERWLPYIDIGPAPDVGPLLFEIGDDPTGVFWG